MELIRVERTNTPEWIAELVGKLAPKLSTSTQFVCKVEDTAVFGKSDRDEELDVQYNNAESVKTVGFDTDGEYKDGEPKNYRDGYVKNRKVTNWNYVIVENVVRDSEGKTKSVQTVYTKNKQLYLELRRAVGLSGY